MARLVQLVSNEHFSSQKGQTPDNITLITRNRGREAGKSQVQPKREELLVVYGARLSRDVFIGGRQIPAYNRPVSLRSG